LDIAMNNLQLKIQYSQGCVRLNVGSLEMKELRGGD